MRHPYRECTPKVISRWSWVLAVVLFECARHIPTTHRLGVSLDAGPAAYPSAYVFADQVHAQAVQSAVDTAQGYPIAGVDVGGGIHAPASESVTTTYYAPIQNPNTGQWAYVADAVTSPVVAPNAVTLGVVNVVQLSDQWFGVPDAGTQETGVPEGGTVDTGLPEASVEAGSHPQLDAGGGHAVP